MSMVKFIKRVGIAALFLFAPHLLSAQSNSQLDSLIRRATDQNPALKSLQTAVGETETRVSQAGALPDPVLGLGLMNLPTNSFAFDQEPMTGKQLSFSQAVPFPGKLGMKSDMVKEDVKISRLNAREKKLEIIWKVKTLYYTIHYLDRAIEVTKKNQKILENFVQVASTKYSVGKGLQQDVLKAQVELSKFSDKLISLHEKRETVVSNLNTLLGRSTYTAFPVTPMMEFTAVPLQHDSLVKEIKSANPVLQIVRTHLDKNKIRTRLAKRNYWPDFKFTVAYTQRDVLDTGMGGVDFLSGAVGVKIPLYFWKKQRKAVQESEISGRKIGQTLDNTTNTIMNRFEDAWQQYKRQGELIELYKNGIIPQATQALNSAISGYQTDKVDFLTMLNDLMVVFNYEKEYFNVLSNYYKQVARINYLAARDSQ